MTTNASAPRATERRILVWDLPTRLFHWLLAASFAGAWLSADSERWRDLHVLLGYTMLGLIGFRLLWGLAGPRHARFASFVHGPARVAAYLRSLAAFSPERHVGHNPAGGWAIVALLALGVLTGATGWMTFNDIGGGLVEELHEGAASAMLALVALHVAAVLASSFLHRENLVRAMLDGFKRGVPAEAIGRPRRIAAAALLAAVAGLWIAAAGGALPESMLGTPAVVAAQDRHGHRDD